MTNADRIRQMSDEKLAKIIAAACPPAKGNLCVLYYQKGSDGCFDCWLDWLKQKVSGNG